MKIVGSLALLVLIATGCRTNHMRYSETELTHFQTRRNAVQLDFHTKKGRQAAFYVGPEQPQALVVFFPGIGSKALDFLPFVDAVTDQSVGCLLLDYPGRGLCEGTMRPKHLPWTFDGASTALAQHLRCKPADLPRTSLVGHSFGSGAALMFAADRHPAQVVMLAPFNTMKRALFRKFGPLAWLIPDNIDNRKLLRSLLTGKPCPPITIIHGDADASLPVAMAEELAAIDPERVVLHIVPGGTHTSILASEQKRVRRILFP